MLRGRPGRARGSSSSGSSPGHCCHSKTSPSAEQCGISALFCSPLHTRTRFDLALLFLSALRISNRASMKGSRGHTDVRK